MSLANSSLAAVGLGVSFELATHILVHYTLQGAALAASIALGVAPFLEGVGLTTVFSASAGETAISSLSPDSPFMQIPGLEG